MARFRRQNAVSRKCSVLRRSANTPTWRWCSRERENCTNYAIPKDGLSTDGSSSSSSNWSYRGRNIAELLACADLLSRCSVPCLHSIVSLFFHIEWDCRLKKLLSCWLRESKRFELKTLHFSQQDCACDDVFGASLIFFYTILRCAWACVKKY